VLAGVADGLLLGGVALAGLGVTALLLDDDERAVRVTPALSADGFYATVGSPL
jgi:hypothetical protein